MFYFIYIVLCTLPGRQEDTLMIISEKKEEIKRMLSRLPISHVNGLSQLQNGVIDPLVAGFNCSGL